MVRSLQAAGAIRYIREEQIGLCIARNRGWRAAHGRYIAFFDDDAIAQPGWLKTVRQAFESAPGAGVIGGPVAPIWEGARPCWLADEIAGSLTIIDWGGCAKVIQDIRREWLAGASGPPLWCRAAAGDRHDPRPAWRTRVPIPPAAGRAS